MKRIIFAILATLAIAVPAQAGKRSPCTVVPDPVSISAGTQYTVTASGGTPLKLYEIIIRQLQDGGTDERRDALVQANESGIVAWTFTAEPWVGPGLPTGLLVGDANVNIIPYAAGGGVISGKKQSLAKCSFVVVE